MIDIFHSTTKRPLEKQTQVKIGSWIHVVEPTEAELEKLSEDFNLELDLLRDATDIYESPRVEKEDGIAYIFTRYCFPDGKDIVTEPLLIVYTQENVITIMRHPSIVVEQLLSGHQHVITTQKTKLLLQILGAVNTSFVRDTHLMSKQILGIRSKLSKADIKNAYFVEFIDLEERLNEYFASLQAQAVVFRSLYAGKFLPLYEDDKDLIEDLTLGTAELIELIKTRLKTISNIRDAYATIMANNLNRIFKRLTSIGIFMAIPTVTASLYGMNVRLPLESHPHAFWIILGLVSVLTASAIMLFKRLKWL